MRNGETGVCVAFEKEKRRRKMGFSARRPSSLSAFGTDPDERRRLCESSAPQVVLLSCNLFETFDFLLSLFGPSPRVTPIPFSLVLVREMFPKGRRRRRRQKARRGGEKRSVGKFTTVAATVSANEGKSSTIRHVNIFVPELEFFFAKAQSLMVLSSHRQTLLFLRVSCLHDQSMSIRSPSLPA